MNTLKVKRDAHFGANQHNIGLLALQFIARKFGIDINIDQLIRENNLVDRRTAPRDIIKCANSVGLRAEALRLTGWSLNHLGRLLPSIAILDDDSCLVIESIVSIGGVDTVLLRDFSLDNDEEISLSLDYPRLRSIWSGTVIVFKQDRSKLVENQPFSLSLIAALIFRDRKSVRDIAISALMLSVLALAPIIFWRLMTDRVLQYHSMSTFFVICLVMGVVFGFETAFGALRRTLLLRVTTRIDVKLTTEMFVRVLNLPVEYFERVPAGLTMHKMGQLGRVRNFLIGQLFGTVLDAGILLFFVPVMFIFSPVLTAVVLATAALICVWIVIMLPFYRRASGAVEGAEAMRGSFLSQSIQGIRTVKSLALETRQTHEWDSLTARVAQLRFEEGKAANLIQCVVTPLERLMVNGSFSLGVYIALNNNDPSSTGALFSFLMLSQRLAAPLIQASQLINQYDEARTAIEVIGSLVNQAPEEGRSGDGVRNPLLGHVDFSGVVFQYKGALKPALKNVSFEIPQGTTLGVMGRSGSGKTTITRLLQRLNPDYSGLVKVDGIDVRNYDLTHFRSSLGVVLQENFLFSGTIRSNITMAKPDATFDEMVHAARLAGAEEFIDKLPAGYETYVYEGSPNLSGGQRQRLAIARALITDPKILILDEATSALDAESEAIVNANIERISQGRTVITISHRLASLVKADAILVMEQGEVNDIGKHEELLERNEIYAHLWYTQNAHAVAAATAAPRPQLTYQGPRDAA